MEDHMIDFNCPINNCGELLKTKKEALKHYVDKHPEVENVVIRNQKTRKLETIPVPSKKAESKGKPDDVDTGNDGDKK